MPDWTPTSSEDPSFELATSFSIHSSRPRVYFRAADVTVMQTRKAGDYSDQYDDAVTDADEITALAATHANYQANINAARMDKMRTVPFLGLLDGNSTYITWATDWALQIASDESSTTFDTSNDNYWRNAAVLLACVYDWLFDDLSAGDKTTLKTALTNYADKIAAVSYIVSPNYAVGHERRGFGAWAAVLIALGSDADGTQLTNCRNHITTGFYPTQAAIAENGGTHYGWAYGATYYNFDLPYLVWTVGTNDCVLDDWVKDLGSWWVYGWRGDSTFPPMGDTWNIDATGVSRGTGAMPLIYAAGRADAQAQWHIDTYIPSANPEMQLLLGRVTGVSPTDAGLATSKHFTGSGHVIARDDWTANSTQFVFSCSPTQYAGHHHHNRNCFLLFDREPLAIDSGGLDEHASDHWLNYYDRTIAHNGVIVYDDEQAFTRGETSISNDGGQLVVAPGSTNTVDGITAYEVTDTLTYVKGVATGSYDITRVPQAERECMFIPGEKCVLVFDRVQSSDTSFEKKYLLHTISEPTVSGLSSTTVENPAQITNVTLFPADATVTKVGGAGSEFEDAEGNNYALDTGGGDYPPENNAGAWRIEVEPGTAQIQDYFLNAVFAEDDGDSTTTVNLIVSASTIGARMSSVCYVFARSSPPLTFSPGETATLSFVVAGFAEDQTVDMKVNGAVVATTTAGTGGLAEFSQAVNASDSIVIQVSTTMSNGYLKAEWNFEDDLSLTDTISSAVLTVTNSNGTYYNSSGTLVKPSSNTARFDHNPSTLASLGLLIEDAAENIRIKSEDFSDASWSKTRASVSANAGVAPDGTTTADKLVEDSTASNSHYTSFNFTPTSGVQYTLSVFAKAVERDEIFMEFQTAGFPSASDCYFDVGDGTILSQGAGLDDAKIVALPSGWYECSITATSDSSSSTAHRIRLSVGGSNSYSGDGSSGLLLWGAQHTTGLKSSYIPTDTVAVTRTADIVSTTSLGWHNESEGAWYSKASVRHSGLTGIRRIFDINAGDDANQQVHSFQGTTGDAAQVVIEDTGTSSFDSTGASTWSDDEQHLTAHYYDATDARAAFDGTFGTLDSSIVLPTGMTTFLVGSADSATRLLGGHVQEILYYNKKDGGTGDPNQFIEDLSNDLRPDASQFGLSSSGRDGGTRRKSHRAYRTPGRRIYGSRA